MTAVLDLQVMRPPTPSGNMTAEDEGSDILNMYCSSLYRKCSNCGRTGHNSRTCLEARNDLTSAQDLAAKLHSNSEGMNETKDTETEEVEISEAGEADQRSKGRESSRKKGVAWTEEEHKQFLSGLQKLGKGNWRGISRHFVQSKSPTQVASHAQKYFIRQTVAGKRKRRSSLFDLVPETESVRETDVASQSTTFANPPASVKSDPVLQQKPNLAEPIVPSIPSMQGPDALAWAYWYQSMLMQSNPIGWMPPMMNSTPPNAAFKPNLASPQASPSVLPVPMMPPPQNGFPSLNDSGPDQSNPMFAAFMAQQSQMAAMMAMNCVPQISPDFMARYAAGLQIHAQAAQAAQSGVSSRQIDSRQIEDQGETRASPDDSVCNLNNTRSCLDDEEPPSKRSKLGSRGNLSNMSSETEDFGNGALFKPKASRARSFADLPSFLQDKRDSGSRINSTSKQSQATQVGARHAAMWLAQQHNLNSAYQGRSSQETKGTDSASHPLETSHSDTPSFLDPNLATSLYKAQPKNA